MIFEEFVRELQEQIDNDHTMAWCKLISITKPDRGKGKYLFHLSLHNLHDRIIEVRLEDSEDA